MKKILIASVCAAVLLSACGGSKKTDTTTTEKTFKPTQVAANVTFNGTAAVGAPLANSFVFAYDAKGIQCATTKTDASGKFSMTGKCLFPAFLASNTPDLQGSFFYSLVPTIDSDGQTVTSNITPLTTAITYIVNAGLPTPGSAITAVKVTKERIDAAHNRFRDLLAPLLKALAIPEKPDFISGNISIGKDQDILLDNINVTYERIASTSQNTFAINLVSENRPVTFVLDSTDPASLRVDAGLGITPDAVDISRLNRANTVISELSSAINGKSASNLSAIADSCFLHNGANSAFDQSVLFDTEVPWGSIVPSASNFRLYRFNTKVNFANTTEDNLNISGGELAFVSFDYLTPRGAAARVYTWMAKGATSMANRCVSVGNNWRIAGNQRSTYTRTISYALHQIDYNSAFSGRTDTYGSGLEFYINDSPNDENAYALVSGPGLDTDGNVFMKIDGVYLSAPSITPLAIRKAYLAFKPSTKCDLACLEKDPKSALTSIYDAVVDTRGVLLTDKSISTIQDGFYNNTYTIRIFKKLDDLFPTYTYEDYLPKRPMLNSEMKPVNYPSLDVNLDSLVSGLQIQQPIAFNWSLPLDSRAISLESYKAGFQRKNCVDITKWPACTKRSQQTNEFFFTQTYAAKGATSDLLTPNSLPPTGTKTFESRLRLFVLDNINRSIEVSIGMNYAR